MLRTLEEALAILTPERCRLIAKVLTDGLAIYDDRENYPPQVRRDHTPRVSADIRNAHIVGEGYRQMLEQSGIRVKAERGRILFFIQDELCLWFKKLTSRKGRLRASSIPTRQAKKFEGQIPLNTELP